jgi:hypothetical protein
VFKISNYRLKRYTSKKFGKNSKQARQCHAMQKNFETVYINGITFKMDQSDFDQSEDKSAWASQSRVYSHIEMPQIKIGNLENHKDSHPRMHKTHGIHYRISNDFENQSGPMVLDQQSQYSLS